MQKMDQCETPLGKTIRTKKAPRPNPRRETHGRGVARTPKQRYDPPVQTGRGAGEKEQATDAATPDRHAKDKRTRKKRIELNRQLTRPKGKSPSPREPEIRPSQKSAKRTERNPKDRTDCERRSKTSIKEQPLEAKKNEQGERTGKGKHQPTRRGR